MFWICPEVSSQLEVPEIHPQRGVQEVLVPRKASVPIPPQLTAFSSKSSSLSSSLNLAVFDVFNTILDFFIFYSGFIYINICFNILL